MKPSLLVKRIKVCLFFVALLLFFPDAKGYSGEATPELVIFYSPSCHVCIELKQKIMPPIEATFRRTLAFRYRDISQVDNFKLLISLQQKYAADMAVKVPVFFLNGKFLDGENLTQDKLLKFIEGAKGLDYRPAAPGDFSMPDLLKRYQSFRPLAVIGAGLVDGINPCAFTVILFFLSFLALQGYSKRQVAAVGAGFIFAVFLTYIVIGLGILNFFYHLEKFYLVARMLNVGIGIASILFGVLACFDIYAYWATKTTDTFILQLPKIVKDRIHSVIGHFYRNTKQQGGPSKGLGWLLATSFITGFLVCLLEAVCTGQMYVPTITFIIKSTPYKLGGLGYLLLYNLVFVLPLVIIVLIVLAGVTSARVGGFLKRHIITVKISMAVLFFGLGIFLIAWR